MIPRTAAAWPEVGGGVLYYPHWFIVGPFVVGVVFSAGLLWVRRPAVRTLVLGRWVPRLLALLVYVGQLSFGLYMFHPIARRWVDMLLPTSELLAGSEVFMAVWLVIRLALSAVSYRFFEEPLLAIARRKSKLLLQTPMSAQSVEPETVTPMAMVR